jgi:hypothetical protein
LAIRSPAVFILKIDIRKFLAASVFHDKQAGYQPRRREAAGRHLKLYCGHNLLTSFLFDMTDAQISTLVYDAEDHLLAPPMVIAADNDEAAGKQAGWETHDQAITIQQLGANTTVFVGGWLLGGFVLQRHTFRGAPKHIQYLY